MVRKLSIYAVFLIGLAYEIHASRKVLILTELRGFGAGLARLVIIVEVNFRRSTS